MAVDERERMALGEDLERALGRDSAVTLMTMLPPTDWADVARRRDLDELEQRVDARFDAAEQRMDDRFAMVDQRFAAVAQRMDDRFGMVDQQFVIAEQRMGDRFASVDQQFVAAEQRMGDRFASVDQQFVAAEQRMSDQFAMVDERFAKVDVQFDRLRDQMLAAFRGELISAVAVQTRTIVFSVVGAFTALGGLAMTPARVL